MDVDVFCSRVVLPASRERECRFVVAKNGSQFVDWHKNFAKQSP